MHAFDGFEENNFRFLIDNVSLFRIRVEGELHDFIRILCCEEVEAIVVVREGHVRAHGELRFLSHELDHFECFAFKLVEMHLILSTEVHMHVLVFQRALPME